MNIDANGDAAGKAPAQFQGTRNGAAFVFFALLMLLGLTGLVVMFQ